MRLVTGAVLPVFNHPLKLAAELAMLDCLSNGRLDAGFARAFLPEEFDAFQVPMDESRVRFEEGIRAVKRLWTEPEVRFDGRFHQFGPVPLFPALCNSRTHRSGLRRSKPLNRLPGLGNRVTT